MLLVVALPLVAGSVANGATPEENDAALKRMERRITAQDKKIAGQAKELNRLRAAQQKSSATDTEARRDEIRRMIKEMKADAGQPVVFEWLENLTFYGDLRLRYHYACFSNGDSEESIGRYRLRVGAKKTWLDGRMEAGFRLASGSSDDPTSTNQSMTGNFGEKQFWLDRAYAKYSPKSFKGFTIIGGKMKTPMVHTKLMWDSDVNPEGVWAVYKHSGWGDIEPFAGFGFFQLVHNTSDGDATLHAYQVGATWKIRKDLKWVSAVAYYDYGHYEDNFSRSKHNTVSGSQLTAEEFNVINWLNKVSWIAFSLPMSAYVDYAYNCGNEFGDDDRYSNAFAIGYKVGKNKSKGDCSAGYRYAYIQANAMPAGFNDSDFGNTNRKGHIWTVKYNLQDYLTAGVQLFYRQPITGSNASETDFLMLADLIWTF